MFCYNAGVGNVKGKTNIMYTVEEKDGYSVYTFNGINLKIKCVDNKEKVYVYINYNGYNPLLSMLFGEFGAECDLDSIDFETQTDYGGMYAVVSKEQLEEFIREVYFFVMENRSVLDKTLNEKDKNKWSF